MVNDNMVTIDIHVSSSQLIILQHIFLRYLCSDRTLNLIKRFPKLICFEKKRNRLHISFLSPLNFIFDVCNYKLGNCNLFPRMAIRQATKQVHNII